MKYVTNNAFLQGIFSEGLAWGSYSLCFHSLHEVLAYPSQHCRNPQEFLSVQQPNNKFPSHWIEDLLACHKAQVFPHPSLAETSLQNSQGVIHFQACLSFWIDTLVCFSFLPKVLETSQYTLESMAHCFLVDVLVVLS